MAEDEDEDGRGDNDGVDITVKDSPGGKGEKEEEQGDAQQGGDAGEERRELVIANQSRLHPGERAEAEMQSGRGFVFFVFLVSSLAVISCK